MHRNCSCRDESFRSLGRSGRLARGRDSHSAGLGVVHLFRHPLHNAAAPGLYRPSGGVDGALPKLESKRGDRRVLKERVGPWAGLKPPAERVGLRARGTRSAIRAD